ncbi:MerR family transcriptional regulator [Schumannella sp. 10F1B-5-1]|uniref:helix-turn-helix domain-containing protein n=1 Tax=Schumannella sp. 10F1B-5-1 TaxID=2590780 RepID=UPI001131DD08|nr:MerR family transcriptional regulator [Schumannella sp. 10F1B-5-1]TPW71524.1 MerR family transcriptional regulator [Schumannella sp. 10F1B-5-1]
MSELSEPSEAIAASAPAPRTHRIGEVAEANGLSLRSLRHWDEVGLLTPSGRTAGGFREYTDADLERLLLIRRMKPLGYTLEQMGELLAVVDDVDAPGRASTLATWLDDARTRQEDLHRKAGMADEFVERLAGVAADASV